VESFALFERSLGITKKFLPSPEHARAKATARRWPKMVAGGHD